LEFFAAELRPVDAKVGLEGSLCLSSVVEPLLASASLGRERFALEVDLLAMGCLPHCRPWLAMFDLATDLARVEFLASQGP